jgi:hypothetical protein
MEHAEATWKGVGEVVAIEHTFEDFFELEQERLLRLLWMVTGSLQEADRPRRSRRTGRMLGVDLALADLGQTKT